MSIYLVTNRQRSAGEFGKDRNPNGNTWWITERSNPLDDSHLWMQQDKSYVLGKIEAEGKPVVLFIHGFNESWKRDMDVLQAVRDGLGDEYALVGLSWDSAGSVFEYFQDRERAKASAGDVMNALIDLRDNMDCPNVIAHSMGNYLLEEALKLVNGATAIYIEKLLMVAADVPFDVLKTSNISQLSGQVLVLYCPADGALAASALLHGGMRLGNAGMLGDGAPNTHSVDCTPLLPAKLNPADLHGAYFTAPKCWDVVRNFLAESKGVAA